MLAFTVKEVISKFRAKTLTPRDICERCLLQLHKTRILNCFVAIEKRENVMKLAEMSSIRWRENKPIGILDGVPFAVKDNYNTEEMNTTCGSNMLKNYSSPYTATVVQKLLNQGAILVGKTNLDEFAMGVGSVDSIYGPVRNPWNYLSKQENANSNGEEAHPISGDFHVAGGSSGGSAVAVASGSSFLALASDTGGSTRNPAAQCGVVGYKPTYGLLSRHGLIPLVNSMDVPGILAKGVDDVALLVNVMAGHDPNDSTTVKDSIQPLSLVANANMKGLSVGIPQEYHFQGLSDEILQAWISTAELFEKAGAKLVTVSLPYSRHSIACYTVLNNCEVASNFARYDGIRYGHRAQNAESTEALYAQSRHEGFNDVVRGRILAGNYFLLKKNYEKYYVQALKVRRLIAQDFQNVFKSGIQVLLTPVTQTTAPAYREFCQKDNREQVAAHDVCTQAANMAGIPAISIPICLSAKDGMPIGLQLMGMNFCDGQLLQVAKWLEQKVMFPRVTFH